MVTEDTSGDIVYSAGRKIKCKSASPVSALMRVPNDTIGEDTVQL